MKSLTKDIFMEMTEACPVIPAVKNDEWLHACKDSECGIVYILYGDICNIADIVQSIKDMGKLAIVHLDLIVGLSAKEISVDFIKKYTKTDGIISTKPNVIKRAKELEMFAIQRFYVMDALNYANVVKHVKTCNPDLVEILPAGLTKIIRYILEEVNIPMVASGLVLDKEDVMGALKAGAFAVSTTNRTVWDC